MVMEDVSFGTAERSGTAGKIAPVDTYGVSSLGVPPKIMTIVWC